MNFALPRRHKTPTNLYRYIAVYNNGLDNPQEIAIHADTILTIDDSETLKEVEDFILSSTDIDCRHILFIYREYMPHEASPYDKK